LASRLLKARNSKAQIKNQKQKVNTMKHQIKTAGRKLFTTVLVALSLGLGLLNLATTATASGGSGSGGGGSTTGVDTIKVSKCEYAVTGSYVELLINASSSNSSAHLYAYLPSGAYLGEVQNGGGGRYGGTVFVTLTVPDYITILSSAGGSIVAPTVPYQP
jgi:hypothetical protein